MVGKNSTLLAAVALGGSTTALGVARSLSPLGVRVIALDENPNATCFFSSCCEARISPRAESDDASGFLLGLAEEISAESGNKAVLFPTTDAWVWALSRNMKKLQGKFLYDFIPEKKLSAIMDKSLLYKAAADAGIAVPKTLPARNAKEAAENAKKLNYPVLVKPIDSERFFAEKYSKGFVSGAASEVVPYFSQMRGSNHEALLQEIISGPETELYTFGSYRSAKGEFVEEFTGRKIRQQPVDFGTCALGESVMERDIIEPSERLLKALGYSGASQVEYKRGKDGKFYLMEVNPRIWLWHSLSTRCGAGIAVAAYKTLAGIPYTGMRGFREHVKWWDAVQDWKSFLDLNRQGRLGFFEWLDSIQGEKDNVWLDSADLMLPLRKAAHKVIYKLRHEFR